MTAKLKDIAEKYKYPLIIFFIGLCFLIPSGKNNTKDVSNDESAMLQDILSRSEGAGETRVLISENGVVVVCEGAEKASVRYNIIGAVKAYTGFSADRITVLKLVN